MKTRDSSSVTTLAEARKELAEWTAVLERSRGKASKHNDRIARARSFIQHYQRQIEALSYPPEPGEGKVVSFRKQYRGRQTIYQFAAVRGGDRWWVTGSVPQSQHGITWTALCDFVRSNNMLLPQDPRPMVDEADATPPF